ncbi:MAG TPA: hypothetical protein VGM83_16310 [Devosiaceae bacterium]|jgi:hypothetical protein
MKFMAIGRVKATPEQLAPHMAKEPAETLRHYLEGKIEQFWFVERQGPIFLLNAESEAEARAGLATLPLVMADLITYELLPVSPLAPLGRLLQT